MVRKGSIPLDVYRKYRNKEYYKRRMKRLRIIKLLGSKCKNCGETNLSSLVIDHIRPIKCNGNRAHTWKDLNNLQILCDKCNLLKSDKTIRY